MFRNRFGKLLLGVFFLACCVLIKPQHVSATTTVNLDNSTNWNIRIDGAQAGDALGSFDISKGDINGDGVDDLIINTESSSYSGRTSIGISYVIYSTLLNTLSGTGNTIDLANSANYNLKIVQAATGDYSDYYGVRAVDLNNNGKQDLMITAQYGTTGGVTSRGLVYILYDSILRSYSGTGNLIDLATSSNYNVKFIGSATFEDLGSSVSIFDFNHDGKPDLAMAGNGATHNTRANSGSVYIVYNDLLASFTGTGNVVNMSTATNFNIRVDGSAASTQMETFIVGNSSDINGDGIDDLLLFEPLASSHGLTRNGSMYILYSTILSSYVGTGNTIDLATSTNYNLRYDSNNNHSLGFGYSITQVVDLDGNGKNDLLFNDVSTDFNSRTNSGASWIVYDSLLRSYGGTGNIIDLATNSNFNIRIDGAFANDLGGPDFQALDFDNNGSLDLWIDAEQTPGIMYVIRHSFFASITGVGNFIDLSNPATYDFDYIHTDGIFDPYEPVDLNHDGNTDWVFTDSAASNNSRAGSGSVYIIYNFPQTDLYLTDSLNGSTYNLNGLISAQNSTARIANVQYQVDGNNPLSGWSSCRATDGAFDSVAENFTCSTNSLSSETHTIYVRAVDTNGAYTNRTSYISRTFIISNGGSLSNYVCPDLAPQGTSYLFRIDTLTKSATLYFSPVSYFTDFFISYARDPSAEEYGTQVTLGNLGVQKYTINDLSSETKYYFKVRPQNGCMPGDWSNIKSAVTKRPVSKTS